MLYELYVENIALLRNMRLSLSPGMNAITGETGAGKSLVIDAVSLLIGARGSDTYIRSGADKSLVEGVFLPPFPQPLADVLTEEEREDTLILSRELIRGGRSVARINGRSVPLARLREVGRLLVNIHGQQEHTLLLEEQRQLTLLDGFGGAACLDALAETNAVFCRLQEARGKVRDYEENQAAREKRMEQLQDTIERIEEVSPKVGEDISLQEEAHLLAHGESLYQQTSLCHNALNDGSGAVERLNEASSILQQASSLDHHLDPLTARLQNLFYEAEDVAREIAAYRDRVNIDAYRLEEVESRIAQLNRLCKRYGGSTEDVLQTLVEAKAEYEALEDICVSGERFYEEEKAAKAVYDQKAEILSTARRGAAERLGNAVTKELHLLSMPNADFRVDLPAVEAGAKGNESVVFMICPNVGEPFQPVSKIASGGELSRILLGIKVILSRLDSVPTLIFDEIDTGMSGRALMAVAERLALVGENTQTVAVSHAAVVAAAAESHILIEKHEEAGRTVATCHVLGEKDRVQELARMIVGDKAGGTTRKQAEEMLQQFHRMG